MKFMILLIAMLAVQWWLLSGMAEPLQLGAGVASIAIVAMFAQRMRVVDGDALPLHLGLALPRFWLGLMGEIVSSNLQMIALILSPKMPLRPQMLELHSSDPTDLGKVLLANAITLTPGTVTVALDAHVLTVHALNDESAMGIVRGDPDRLVAGVFKRSRARR